ncbi:MAG: LamG-like jellyroll fold domain-containing protein [Phycisphaerales bacterium]
MNSLPYFAPYFAASLAVLIAASAHAWPPELQQTASQDASESPSSLTTSSRVRFITSRTSPVELALPHEEDSFTFIVFGDRTGGPAEGIEILKQAVADANVIEADLVMTVGDLVEGYNDTPQWMTQMREFKGAMDALTMPWFPVAGNHDIYWRGEGERPSGEHEHNFETHFGPLWYAFEHKNSWFIALFSDEGDPETGRKSFERPESQRMSAAQFQWLRETLGRAREAEHIFIFLHHPRWLEGGYGDDWKRVHALLAEAGNVTAVFAGHIHNMRYDGPRDGIEYIALATVGGAQPGYSAQAGYLHQLHLITVRHDHIALAALPVGEVMDVRAITGKVSDEARQLAQSPLSIRERFELGMHGSGAGEVVFELNNPTSAPIEVAAWIASDDSRWRSVPDHLHLRMQPGESQEVRFAVTRRAAPLDDTFRAVELCVDVDYIASGRRFAMRRRQMPIPLRVKLNSPAVVHEGESERVLAVDGDDCLRIEADSLSELPDGPLTLECWFNATEFSSRMGLINKTESSEFGFFLNRGIAEFDILLGDRYVTLKAAENAITTGKWHHIAGVYDGEEVRLYIDGRNVQTTQRAAARRQNQLPLYIGADVDQNGRPVSYFNGRIDSVRLSSTARYHDDFIPERRMHADAATELLFNMDEVISMFLYDESPHSRHAVMVGQPRVVNEN